MILLLATRYRKCVAFLLFFVAGFSHNLTALANEAGLRGVFMHAPVIRHYPGAVHGPAATPDVGIDPRPATVTVAVRSLPSGERIVILTVSPAMR